MYVAASLAGRRGVVRISPSGGAEWVISGQNIVGIAFTGHRTMILAANTVLYEITINVQGANLPVAAG
jgi:hypothetical protein